MSVIKLKMKDKNKTISVNRKDIDMIFKFKVLICGLCRLGQDYGSGDRYKPAVPNLAWVTIISSRELKENRQSEV